MFGVLMPEIPAEGTPFFFEVMQPSEHIISAIRSSGSQVLGKCGIYPVFVRSCDDDTLPYIVVYSSGKSVNIHKDGMTPMSDSVCIQFCCETYDNFTAVFEALLEVVEDFAENPPIGMEVTSCTVSSEEYDEDKSGYYRDIILTIGEN